MGLARRPTVDSRCHGTTIICCMVAVADPRRCLPTTSLTGVQQSTRYCGALICRHLCMMTPSLYTLLDLPHRASVSHHARSESQAVVELLVEHWRGRVRQRSVCQWPTSWLRKIQLQTCLNSLHKYNLAFVHNQKVSRYWNLALRSNNKPHNAASLPV